MSRGNRRLAIFRERSDYHEFLECLAMTKETCVFTIHALCLMTNHFHMCIETEDVEIWKIMHRLLLTYAANYNIKYKVTGHLFENRYIGQLIEDDRYFLEVSRYIHLNPVKAGNRYVCRLRFFRLYTTDAVRVSIAETAILWAVMLFIDSNIKRTRRMKRKAFHILFRRVGE